MNGYISEQPLNASSIGASTAVFLLERMDVAQDIKQLVEEIQRLGSKNADGQTCVKFGVLFNDDRCANIFEALVGTLKAAKRKKVVSFESEMLFQGVHDNVDVILLQE